MRVSKRVLSYRISEESILLINTLTGALDVVSPDIYHELSKLDTSGHLTIDDFTRERLKRRGYIFDSIENEAQWIQRIKDAHTKTAKRLTFVVCPTYKCNLRCTYCFEGDLTNDSRNSMGIEDVEMIFSAIDKLSDEYKERRRTIELFGGEPLLPANKKIIGLLFKEAQKRSIPVSIVTNGVFVTDYADILERYNDIVGSVQVTIDGPRDIHDLRRKSGSGKGSFDKIRTAIDRLLELRIKVHARTNVDVQNIGHLHELLSFFTAKGWVDSPQFVCNLAPVEDHGCTRAYEFYMPQNLLVAKFYEEFKEHPEMAKVFQLNLFRTLRHINSVLSKSRPVLPLLHYCEANNFEHVVFGPDGYVYACTESMGDRKKAVGEFRPQLKLYEDAVKMWGGRNVFRMKKCRECDIALLCGGGCAYSALVVNGDINEPVCNNARETIFAYLDYIQAELVDKASA
ncbi:MAG: radical SAM protein [Actinobacteria bacterium]|nr:radical SAM protein [Actinomycetota bacterium]